MLDRLRHCTDLAICVADLTAVAIGWEPGRIEIIDGASVLIRIELVQVLCSRPERVYNVRRQNRTEARRVVGAMPLGAGDLVEIAKCRSAIDAAGRHRRLPPLGKEPFRRGGLFSLGGSNISGLQSRLRSRPIMPQTGSRV
ncbi:hypothetical protein [Rhodopseudomonas palustris]|uniref:Uncharacterized protein n=1 Tax=Rhodopseudomonas palustris (strain ATCC BAA-98 / CGA009) TaxID=258594 RepID=A0AAE9Y1N4_RHOPA|nr:hypothetical protein [Rhodopseudomonas palustris]WAB77003.1 hypothetical protein OR798_21305 [Rhodopseudomonas palustris]WCL94298.1 hypothetical protein TX73_021300 [Rhodopseudomonas palustris CGA009]WND50915.1 hypothetical protein L1A21_21225 [Rhodopseudomonas palustris]